MLVQVLKYHVFGDGTVDCGEVNSASEVATPITFFQIRKFAQQLKGIVTLFDFWMYGSASAGMSDRIKAYCFPLGESQMPLLSNVCCGKVYAGCDEQVAYSSEDRQEPLEGAD